jgi:hypothetical protein
VLHLCIRKQLNPLKPNTMKKLIALFFVAAFTTSIAVAQDAPKKDATPAKKEAKKAPAKKDDKKKEAPAKKADTPK